MFSLGECIFTVDNPELYRDHSCKVIFKYVVNDEVCKDIRGKVIKDNNWIFALYPMVCKDIYTY